MLNELAWKILKENKGMIKHYLLFLSLSFHIFFSSLFALVLHPSFSLFSSFKVVIEYYIL